MGELLHSYKYNDVEYEIYKVNIVASLVNSID